jgi:hypothetical protein
MLNNWLPLEHPWKHHWDKLQSADQLVTIGMPLETPLGWDEGFRTR